MEKKITLFNFFILFSYFFQIFYLPFLKLEWDMVCGTPNDLANFIALLSVGLFILFILETVV